MEMKYRSYTNDELVDMLIEETNQLYIPALVNVHITILDLRKIADKMFYEIDPYEVPGAIKAIRDFIIEKGKL